MIWRVMDELGWQYLKLRVILSVGKSGTDKNKSSSWFDSVRSTTHERFLPKKLHSINQAFKLITNT